MYEFQTTIGSGKAVVTVNYEADDGEANSLEVLLGGIDISDALTDDQLMELDMECQAHYDQAMQDANDDAAIDAYIQAHDY